MSKTPNSAERLQLRDIQSLKDAVDLMLTQWQNTCRRDPYWVFGKQIEQELENIQDLIREERTRILKD